MKELRKRCVVSLDLQSQLFASQQANQECWPSVVREVPAHAEKRAMGVSLKNPKLLSTVALPEPNQIPTRNAFAKRRPRHPALILLEAKQHRFSPTNPTD